MLSLVNTETSEVRSRVVPNVTGATLRDALLEQVDTPTSTLYTDPWKGYAEVGRKFVGGHESVDHSAGEYVRGKATRNHAEGYFSQLKRSIDGTHHYVSLEHLPRYGRVRLSVQHPQVVGLPAHAADDRPERRSAVELQATKRARLTHAKGVPTTMADGANGS